MEVAAELTLKIAGLQAGLEKARSEMDAFRRVSKSHGHGAGAAFAEGLNEKFKEGLMLLGVPLTFGAAVEGINRLIESYSHLADIAQRFDAAPESMQRLEFHAVLAGTNLDAAAGAITRLQIAMERSADDPGMARALAELNLSAVDLAGLNPEEQMEKLAEAFNHAQQSGTGLVATKELLGKGFAELIPMLREWDEVAKDMPNVLSDEDVGRMKKAGDFFTVIGQGAKQIAAGALLDFAADFGDLVNGRGYGTSRAKQEARKEQLKDYNPMGPDPKLLKEWQAKKETADRMEAAAREKTQKSIQEAQEKEAALQKQLNDLKREASEADYNQLEKLGAAQARSKELEAEIDEARNNGPQQVGEVLRLQIQQAQVLREIGNLSRSVAESDRQQAQALEDAKRKAMDVADAKAKQVQNNVQIRGDLMAELQLMELQAAGRHKAVEKLKQQMQFEADKKRFMEAGMSPEEAEKMAGRMAHARDRIAHPGKIYGYKGEPHVPFSGLDWLREHRDGKNPMTKEWKFPGLDSLVRLQTELVEIAKDK